MKLISRNCFLLIYGWMDKFLSRSDFLELFNCSSHYFFRDRVQCGLSLVKCNIVDDVTTPNLGGGGGGVSRSNPQQSFIRQLPSPLNC